MLYIHHPSSLAHDPRALSPDHPDHPLRVEAIERAIPTSDLHDIERLAAPAASESELELVHDAAHVSSVRTLCASGGGWIDADTVVGPTSYTAARHAAGGACAMVRALLGGRTDRAFCALRPAGHHADRDRAMGFCLFNNVAIAAELAIQQLGVRRVLIVDWDVHHGNGTSEIFRRRADVVVADIHQSGLYPRTGALTDTGSGPGRGYTVNIPVPRFSDEEPWISVVEHIVVPIGLEFRPDLVLISAGFDAHRSDPLGECRLEAASYGQLACHLRGLADDVQAPVGAVLEGGYDPEALAECVVATMLALRGKDRAESIAPDRLITPQVASHVGHFWTLEAR